MPTSIRSCPSAGLAVLAAVAVAACPAAAPAAFVQFSDQVAFETAVAALTAGQGSIVATDTFNDLPNGPPFSERSEVLDRSVGPIGSPVTYRISASNPPAPSTDVTTIFPYAPPDQGGNIGVSTDLDSQALIFNNFSPPSSSGVFAIGGRFATASSSGALVDPVAPSNLFIEVSDANGGGDFVNLNTPSDGYAFYGFISDTPITELRVTPQVGGNFAVVDDLRLATVPEPSSLALTAVGLAAVGRRLRRKVA